jgi:pimeloyl-ACP methyl ester carboxylesterase
VCFVDNQAVKIYWDELGSGEPLLLINGLGTSSHSWHRSRPVFANNYRTIALDNRGVGRSDVPAGIYSIESMAADANAVLDAAGVETAHVFGVSLGGMIAQELALRHPQRVRSLILGCTTASEPTGPYSVPPEPGVLMALMRRSASAEESNEAFRPLLYDAGTPRERVDEDMAIRVRWHPTAQGYMGQLQGVSGWDAYSRLGDIRVPTLVIHGENDRLIPCANAGILAERIARAQLALNPEAGHVFWTDQPDAVHERIFAFLRGIAGKISADKNAL